MEKKPSRPDPAILEQYRRQLLEMRNRQTVEENNWLDRRFPEPTSPFNRQAVNAEGNAPETTESDEHSDPLPPIAETPFIGYLRVFVTTAEGAQPISDAYVTVTRNSTVYANTVTDRDGYTAIIPLPALNPELTLSPENATPYLAYNIRVYAEGFRTVQYDNVPIYGNDYVTQQASLHPLLYNDDPDAVQNFLSGGPENL